MSSTSAKKTDGTICLGFVRRWNVTARPSLMGDSGTRERRHRIKTPPGLYVIESKHTVSGHYRVEATVEFTVHKNASINDILEIDLPRG